MVNPSRHLNYQTQLQMPMKLVMKLDLHSEKGKKGALKALSVLQGIESIALDMKDKKITVIGEVDPVDVVGCLRKRLPAVILSVGPRGKKEEPPEEKKIQSDLIKELHKLYS